MNDFSVLLIDDNDADNFIHRRVIRKMGFASEISTASDGSKAIDFLRERAGSDDPFPRMVLVDINMPIMNGWEFLDAYAAEFGHRTDCVVVAMVSTSTSPDDVQRAEEHDSVEHYLEKPLTTDHVRLMLAEHFPDVEIGETV